MVGELGISRLPIENVRTSIRYNVFVQYSGPLTPIDYLVIGHITVELTPEGARFGGPTVYAALTARALGLRVGVVTARDLHAEEEILPGIPLAGPLTDQITRIEMLKTPGGMVRVVRQIAPKLDYYHIPETWRSAPLVHLAPVAQEVEPSLVRRFEDAFLGVTAKGWLRMWNEQGEVYPGEWPEATFVLGRANAAVVSLPEVGGGEGRIDEWISASDALAVLDPELNVRIFWKGETRTILAPNIIPVDPTGADDIFAASFFATLHKTGKPGEAAELAARLCHLSVMRPGLEGIPTYEDLVTATDTTVAES